jgi:hypothetical protein
LEAKTCQYAWSPDYVHQIPSDFQNSKCALRSNVTFLLLEPLFHPTTWTPEP